MIFPVGVGVTKQKLTPGRGNTVNRREIPETAGHDGGSELFKKFAFHYWCGLYFYITNHDLLKVVRDIKVHTIVGGNLRRCRGMFAVCYFPAIPFYELL